ncbi:MAG: hypothetical protein LBS60_13115, partial [Deltaproteobacteria bacterium]|nr:hypothetical protein [Deltaproteobacteria bacterium]
MKQKLNNQSLGSSYWIFSFLALSLTLSLTVFLAFWGVAPGKAADLSYEPLFVTGGGGGGASGGGGGGGAGGGGGQGGSGAGGDGSSNLGTSGAHGGSGGGGGGGGGAANDDPSHRPDNGENGKDATTSQGGTNAAGGHEGFGAGNGDPGDGSSDNLAAGGAPNSGYTTGGDGASGGDGGDGGDGSDVVNGATGTGFNGGAGGGSTGINTGAGGSGSGTSGSGGTGGGVNSNGDDGGDGDNGPNGQPGKTGDDGDPAGAQTGSGWTATVTPPSATYDFITLKSASGGEGGKGGSGGDAGADGGDGGDGAKAADRSTYTGGNGGSGGAGGKGGAGGAGGAGGDGGTQLDIDIRVNGTFEALTITGRSELIAGDGGQGAAGGASGHDNPSATNIGGIGGDGGDGGSGADIFLTFLKDPTKSNTVITFKDIFNAIAGSGLKGGAGGEKFSATSQGGAGGDSLTGGSVSVDFQTDFVVFERNATLTAGDGGDGGEGGANSGGQGGKGGDGGAVTLTAIDAILNGAHLAVTSGTAGSDGTLNTFGVGGAGGAAQVTISHDLLALKDSDLNFTIGDTLGTNPGGNLNFTVDRRLYIASSQAVRLNITGTMNPGDDAVSFSTLYLEPNSSLTTSSSVYSYINPGTTSYYQVNSLDVITQGSWSTAGVFAPDNINSPYNDYIRFDLSDISPNDTILTFSGSTGAINLQDFNPIAQQNAYLSSPGWSKYSDVPGILEYRRDELAPAFITGVYQTKPLDLGLLTLADRTTGVLNPLVSELRADGNFHYISQGVNYHVDPLYDDFAFTAGLRRYYFDVFVDASDPNLPLKARNYHTADATKIYYQGAGAALVSANQTLEVTLNALDK